MPSELQAMQMEAAKRAASKAAGKQPLEARTIQMEEFVESLKSREHLRLLKGYLEKAAPDILEAMLHSRDRLMVDNIMRE